MPVDRKSGIQLSFRMAEPHEESKLLQLDTKKNAWVAVAWSYSAGRLTTEKRVKRFTYWGFAEAREVPNLKREEGGPPTR